MRRAPPRSTRTDTLFPYTTLFRSAGIAIFEAVGQQEIDDLVLGRALPVIGGRRGAREGQRDDGCEQAHAGTPAAQGCAMKSSWVGRCAAVRATIVSMSAKKPASSSRVSWSAIG